LFQEPQHLTEPRTALLGGREVGYLLQRSAKRRSVVLTIGARGLVVHAPWHASERTISDALRDAQSWALRKLAVWETHRPRTRTWRSGEVLDFLGRQIALEVIEVTRGATAQLDASGVLTVCLPKPHVPERVRDAVAKWYRRHALDHFTARVAHFSALLPASAPRVSLSNAKTRWGSCLAREEVRLTWRLMQAAAPVIDYVVAHEVAHLKYMSHGARFWGTVERLYPDYASARAELNAMGNHYMGL
jgi:predicted metal-dependent hydrolase